MKLKSKRSRNPELIALLLGLIAAFFAPIWAVDFAADKGYYGAVVFTNGLKNLGFGDMGRGIGVCGIIGLVSAISVSLVVYSLLLWWRSKKR